MFMSLYIYHKNIRNQVKKVGNSIRKQFNLFDKQVFWKKNVGNGNADWRRLIYLWHKRHKNLKKKKRYFSKNLGKCSCRILEDIKKLLYPLKFIIY